ncbi:V-type ATP synthase subunit C [uncultured archaeon]|nr:V-type ATP synthase subunit C [uncultured archaeon]
MPGFRDAIKYGYSNTRVKAMESKLITKDATERMLASKEIESIGASLLQTAYKDYIEEFGGTKSMGKLIDFALSKSLGHDVNRMIDLAPKSQKEIVRSIVGVWDISNIKFMIGALSTGKSFDDISRYLIDTKYAGPAKIREAMATNSAESAIGKLVLGTPYKSVLKSALEAYRKSKDPMDVDSAIDEAYYSGLGDTMEKLREINKASADLIGRRIDVKNVLTLLNAKKHGAEFATIRKYLVPNGGMGMHRMASLFESSKTVEALAGSVAAFDLKSAIADYEASRNKSLLTFEIAMMNEVFAGAFKTVRHSVLSFSTIIGYVYLKEMEVSALRVIVKGKSYELGEAEIRKMISWFN